MKVKTCKPGEKYSVNYKPSVDSSKMRFVDRLKDSRAVSTSRLSTCSISPPPSPLITMSISYKNHSTHKNPKLYNNTNKDFRLRSSSSRLSSVDSSNKCGGDDNKQLFVSPVPDLSVALEDISEVASEKHDKTEQAEEIIKDKLIKDLIEENNRLKAILEKNGIKYGTLDHDVMNITGSTHEEKIHDPQDDCGIGTYFTFDSVGNVIDIVRGN